MKKIKLKRVFFIAFFSLLSVIILSAFLGFISFYEPPRHGRVIDADTKEPIEGVVVMGYWDINYLPDIFIGAPSYYYDARETVTDEEGYFTLPGLGPWLYPGYLQGPYTSVYKKGYKNVSFSWKSKIVLGMETTYSPTYERYNLKWKKGRLNIPLQKPDEEESVDVSDPDWRHDGNKIKRYLQEIDHHSHRG
ncbi:MAG: carboxypeptidase-like regulatory domain-containing protein [Desulfobacteraceae bacterium]|nr:carboxypeptidase-like regulatory domain-containing protein [Desulfobacteraceae bacterium]